MMSRAQNTDTDVRALFPLKHYSKDIICCMMIAITISRMEGCRFNMLNMLSSFVMLNAQYRVCMTDLRALTAIMS